MEDTVRPDVPAKTKKTATFADELNPQDELAGAIAGSAYEMPASDVGAPDSASPEAVVEAYHYDPEERGETWDIYKQRSVMENTSKRQSEDAVLMKAKMEAALKEKAVAEAVANATAGLQQVSSAGRTVKGRTAIAQTAQLNLPTEEAMAEQMRKRAESEEDDDSDDADEAEGLVQNDGSENVQEAAAAPLAQEDAAPAPNPAPVDSSAAPATQATAAPEAVPAAGAAAPAPAAAGDRNSFPLETLQNSCPEGVPPSQKEDFLSDADFALAFKMSREEFAKLPGWKKATAKKNVKIF